MEEGERQTLIRANTKVVSPPLCPELRLHAAADPVDIWMATERRGAHERPPFWAHAWPGGIALARYVLDHPELVRGRRVLDFAAGGGISGIAAMKANAREVIATELDPFAHSAIKLNASLNEVRISAKLEDRIGLVHGFDVLLVGDVFYEQELAARVMSWLLEVASHGVPVLIGDPGRSFLPKEKLTRVATYPLRGDPAWDSVLDRDAAVWRVAT